MIEYTSPMPKGVKDVDIYLEPDGTLSFEWHKGKIMSEKLTVEQLRALHNQNRPVAGVSTFDSILGDLYNFNGQLLDVIEAQDVRIKALEDRLNSIPPTASYHDLF